MTHEMYTPSDVEGFAHDGLGDPAAAVDLAQAKDRLGEFSAAVLAADLNRFHPSPSADATRLHGAPRGAARLSSPANKPAMTPKLKGDWRSGLRSAPTFGNDPDVQCGLHPDWPDGSDQPATDGFTYQDHPGLWAIGIRRSRAGRDVVVVAETRQQRDYLWEMASSGVGVVSERDGRLRLLVELAPPHRQSGKRDKPEKADDLALTDVPWETFMAWARGNAEVASELHYAACRYAAATGDTNPNEQRCRIWADREYKRHRARLDREFPVGYHDHDGRVGGRAAPAEWDRRWLK